MNKAISELIGHLQQQAAYSEYVYDRGFFTRSYEKLLDGKETYIDDHNNSIKLYIEKIERLQTELSQLELFKRQLIITTGILYNGELMHRIENYIANKRIQLESLSGTLLHLQSLDVEVDYEQQLSLSKNIMENYLLNEEKQKSFNKEYSLVKDSLSELQVRLFGD